MNEAKAQLDSGNLGEAVSMALAAVKSKPTDITARTFLFELSCFSGDWDRAEKQLEVIGQQDVNAMVGAQIYRQNLKAERDRVRFYEEGLMPECLMPPPKYVDKLLAANNYVRTDDSERAAKVFEEIEEERPAFACKINGEQVEDFRDYNDLTSCVFETIIKGSYAWLPFEQVKSIKFFERESLRDLYWRQAEVEMTNGTQGEMFFPSLYANSQASGNDDIRLGRATDWTETDAGTYIGSGIRIFAAGSEYKPMPELEKIEFIHEDEGKEEPDDSEE